MEVGSQFRDPSRYAPVSAACLGHGSLLSKDIIRTNYPYHKELIWSVYNIDIYTTYYYTRKENDKVTIEGLNSSNLIFPTIILAFSVILDAVPRKHWDEAVRYAIVTSHLHNPTASLLALPQLDLETTAL